MVQKYKLGLTLSLKEDIDKLLSHQYLASKHKWVDFGFFYIYTLFDRCLYVFLSSSGFV